MISKSIFMRIALTLCAISSFNEGSAQTSSMGPGKGPPTPGGGKSKFTYPQPPKTVPVPLSAMHPSAQIPEFPEKYIWKLTPNAYGVTDTGKEIAIYSFSYKGQKSRVGSGKPGDIVTLDEVRPVGKGLFYKITWADAPAKQPNAPEQEYWVNGANVEFGGVR